MIKKHVEFLEKIVDHDGCCDLSWDCEHCPFNKYKLRTDSYSEYLSCFEALIVPHYNDDTVSISEQDINMLYKTESIKLLFDYYMEKSLQDKKQKELNEQDANES